MLKQIKKLADRLGNILINFAGLRKEPEPKENKPVIYSIREKGFTKNNSKVFYIIYGDDPKQVPLHSLICAQERASESTKGEGMKGFLFLSDPMITRINRLKGKEYTELNLNGKSLYDYLINGED